MPVYLSVCLPLCKKKLRQFNKNLIFSFVTDNPFVCDCRLSWMYELRNVTKNERVKSVLDELICYMDDPSGLKSITKSSFAENNLQTLEDDGNNNNNNKYPDGDDYENIDDFNYGQQQDSSHNYVTESHDPRQRHLLQLTPSELPCDTNEAQTEASLNVKMTPAYAEMNFNTNKSVRINFTIFLNLITTIYLCLT